MTTLMKSVIHKLPISVPWPVSYNLSNGLAFSSSKMEIPTPPKRPLSAYLIFCKENRKQMLNDNPSLTTCDLIKKLAEKWNNLSHDMKEPYLIHAREIAIQYGEEHKKYFENLSEEQKKELARLKSEKKESRHLQKMKKLLQESGIPRPPGSTYSMFVSSQAKHKTSSTSAADFLKEVGEKWRKLSEEEKKVFEEEAQLKKQKYMVELENWKKRMEKEKRLDVLDAYAAFEGRGKSEYAWASTGKKKTSEKKN